MARSLIACLAFLFLGLGGLSATAAPESGEPVVLEPGLATGSWQDTVPIDVPPAPNQSQPSVALVADHHVVDGELGTGWRLDVGSKITRHSLTGGAPNFTVNAVGVPTDSYHLDGRELVWTASPAPQHYEPETYDGSILAYSSASNTWTRRKEGWTWTYGSMAGTGSNATMLITDAASLTVPVPPNLVCASTLCRTSTWYLSRAVDPFGNVILYNYAKKAAPGGLPYAAHEHVPQSIVYSNGERVDFTYGSRKDPRFVVKSGSPTVLSNRLKEISTTVNGQMFSRYVIQYEDEASDARLGGPLTDCDGNTIAADDPHPKLTLIRKIVRVGTNSTTQHTLRCIKSRHETTTWDTHATAKILNTIVAPTPRLDLTNEVAIPIAANLDFDAITDLVVLGISGSRVTGHAYISTPKLDRAFASATVGNNAPHDMAIVWDAELAKLDFSLFSNHRGWALADLDGDLIPEVIYEQANGDVVIDRLLSSGTGFSTTATSLSECDLRNGEFADIDADSHADLVIRAHGADNNGCNAVVRTKWIRNSGSGSYFDPANKQVLAVPLEATTKPTEWNTIMTGVCAAAGAVTSGPYDINATWELTPEAYVADNARIADFTGDGIADIAYSLYGCWTHTATDLAGTATNESTWATVPSSVYSRLFVGDGQGHFIDSRMTAGPPLTFTLDEAGSSSIVTDRLLGGILTPVDTDHDGYPELMSSRAVSEGIEGRINHYQDLTAGWNLATGVIDGNGTRTDGLLYLSPACNCYLRIGTEALGDFTGDGMVDILGLATDTFVAGTPSSTPCPPDQWCAVLYRNLRTGSEGRMLSSDGPWGGRTQLTWGFSAQDPNDNPNLRFNLEVIQKVVGNEGPVSLTYSGGWTWGTRPTVFAQVERENARGGVDELEFVTAPWAEGEVSHAARFRKDRTLEHLEVYVRGQVFNGNYVMSYSTPYFNPVARHCIYEVGNGGIIDNQSVSIEELVQQCYGYAGAPRQPPSNESGVQLLQVPLEKVPLILGQTGGLRTPNSAPEFDAVFGARTFNYGAISAADAWSYELTSVVQLPPPFLASAIPSLLAGNVPDVEGAEEGYRDPVEWPTPYVEFVQDFTWNLGVRQLTGSFDYRDTATNSDDRVHAYFYFQPDTSGYWYRLTKHDTRNRTGGQLWSEQHSAFHTIAMFVPLDTKQCGSAANVCTTDTYSYDPLGNQTSHVFPDGTIERWTHGACGEIMSHTDQALRMRANTLDSACRLESSTFEGSAITVARDGLGRVTRTTVAPGGGSPTTSLDTYYDDALAFRSDTKFLEPRIGNKRSDGKVGLSYFDGFGRTTKQVECTAGAAGGGQTGVLAQVSCRPGSERIAALNVYGTDGLRKIHTEPFVAGETPVTHGTAHDGYGRPIVKLDPSHEGTIAWATTTYRRSAAWDETIDALGHATRTTFSTLERETTVGNVRRKTLTYDVRGWLVDETGPDGSVVRHAYDTLGRLDSLTRLFDTQCISGAAMVNCHWRHRYPSRDAMGRTLRELDASGTPRDYTYDAIGRITSVAIDGVLVEDRTYIAGPTPTVEIVDENGATVTVTSDGLGRILRVDGDDVSRATAWNVNGQRAEEIDVNGRTTTYGYDAYDRLVEIVAPGGVTTQLAYDGNNHLLSTTDADGVVMSHEYTYAGDLSRTVRAGHWVERRKAYDALGRPSDVTDEGVRTVYAWDTLGRLTHVDHGIGANGPEETIDLTYDTGDRVLTRTVAPRIGVAATTQYSYDGWGQLATTTDATNHVWSVDRDILGRPRFERDPLGLTTETRYDDRGRVVAHQTPGGWEYTAYETDVGYPAAHPVIRNLGLIKRWDSGDPLDGSGKPLNPLREYRDSLGRAVAEISRTGTVHESTWSGDELIGEAWSDAAGVQALVDRVYDNRGRLSRRVGPYAPADGAPMRDTVDYAYSNAGRTLQTITPEETTTFTYNGGLLATEAYADQVRWLTYANANVPWITTESLSGSGSMRRTDFVRDGLRRIVGATTTAPGLATVERTSSGYTAFGAPTVETRIVGGTVEATTSWTFDAAGRPLQRTLTPSAGSTASVAWNWQANGLLASVTSPSNVTLGYDYGGDHLLDRVYNLGTGQEHAVVVTRNGRGRATRIDQPIASSTQTFVYDDADRLLLRTLGPQSGLPTSTWTTTYDWAGRVASEDFSGATDAWTTDYEYDGRGRLASEYRSRTAERRSYRWSRGGNLLQVELDPGTGPAPVMVAAYSGQRLTSVNSVPVASNAWGQTERDQHGNKLTYTADGEIRSIAGTGASPVEILRDAAGLPVVHLEGGAEPRQLAYGLDPADLPLEVHQSDGVDRTYVTAFGSLLGTLQNGAFSPTVTDASANLVQHDSEVLASDSAFGAGIEPPTGTDERFGFGKLESVKGAVGIELARHRSYDTETGRFQAPDPLGLDGGPHRYLYGGGDPVGYIDPMGWSCLPDTAALPSIVAFNMSVMSPRYIEGALGGPAQPSTGPFGSDRDSDDEADDDDSSDDTAIKGDDDVGEDGDTDGDGIPTSDEPVGGGVTVDVEEGDGYADAGEDDPRPVTKQYEKEYTGDESKHEVKKDFRELCGIKVLGKLNWDEETQIWWTDEWQYISSGDGDVATPPGGGSTEILGSLGNAVAGSPRDIERMTPADFHDGPIARSSPVDVLQYMPFAHGVGLAAGMALSGAQNWLESQYWWAGAPLFPQWWLDRTGFSLLGGPVGFGVALWNGWTNDDLGDWLADPTNQGELSVVGELLMVSAVASEVRSVLAESAAASESTVLVRQTKYPLTNTMRSEYIGEETGAVWGTRVRYLDDAARATYRLEVRNGLLYDASGNLFDTGAGNTLVAGGGKAIFVMDEQGNLFASLEHSLGEFHHSSFLGGKPVAGAGELEVDQGVLKSLSRRSGHYRPTEQMTDQVRTELQSRGVDMSGVTIKSGY